MRNMIILGGIGDHLSRIFLLLFVFALMLVLASCQAQSPAEQASTSTATTARLPAYTPTPTRVVQLDVSATPLPTATETALPTATPALPAHMGMQIPVVEKISQENVNRLRQITSFGRGDIVWLRFSPDSRWLVAGFEILNIFEAGGFEPVAVIEGRNFAFSPDSRLLAVRSKQGDEIKIYQTETWQVIHTFPSFADPLQFSYDISFSKDGRYLAAGLEEGRMRIWQTDDWRPFQDYDTYGVAFSPVEDIIAIQDAEGISVQRIDDGQERFRVNNKKNLWGADFLFTSDGKYLLVATIRPPASDKIEFFNVEDGSPVYPSGWDYYTSQLDARSSRYSSDGVYTAQDAGDGFEITVIDQVRGQPQFTLSGFKSWVDTFTFSPDGRYFAANSLVGTLQIANMMDGKVVKVIEGFFSWNRQAVISPREQSAVLVGNSVSILNLADGSIRDTLEGYDVLYALPNTAAFSPDGETLVIGDINNYLWSFDYNTGELLSQTETRESSYPIAVSPVRPVVAGRGIDSVVLRDVQTLEVHQEIALPGNDWGDYSLAFSKDGNWLAAGGESGRVHLIDVQTNQVTAEFEMGENRVGKLAFSPDGKFLIGSSFGNPYDRGDKNYFSIPTIQVWSLETGSLLHSIDFTQELIEPGAAELDVQDAWVEIESLDFSPDGGFFMTSASLYNFLNGYTIQHTSGLQFWRLGESRPFYTMRTEVPEGVVFSPLGNYLVTLSGLWGVLP